MGGVGGTVTVLCYGYWIREVGRTGEKDLRTCRIDLVFGYLFTAMFGLSMVIIGSTLDLHGSKGATLVMTLADQLQRAVHPSIGPALHWAFMIGAWAAFFTSVLGVWQAVPYLFADFVNIARDRKQATIEQVDRKSTAYRAYLIFISTVPLIGLFFNFQQVQKFYSLFGAYFMPMLALVLLLMTTRRDWIGEKFVSKWPTRILLMLILIAFALMGWKGIGD
jgi:Mn2+/Fe2+ NRAMP family transporter